MTPLECVNNAYQYLQQGNFCYLFDVPKGKNMHTYTDAIRELARRRGWNLRVAYYGKGRTWLIKLKV